MLHFAYGSNMSRVLMAARCRGAEALGLATLRGWRFVINAEGFGSIAPLPGGRVHGVLWRLTSRDLVAINAYESIDTRLYLRQRLPVRFGDRQVAALVYIASRGGKGRARPSYMQLVVEAACEWQLPDYYIRSLARWSSSRWIGARARDTGELG
jgi:hypothetical protein